MSCQISPNADIAGIGVRIAVYAQAILALIPAYLLLWQRSSRISETDQYQNVKGNMLVVLLTGCAILASALIQSFGQGGLSLYHILIVLNLSWINSITAHVCACCDSNPKDRDIPRLYIIIAVHNLMIFLVGMLVFWPQLAANIFDPTGLCRPLLVYYLPGLRITFTSPGLQYLSLAAYFLNGPAGIIPARLLGLRLALLLITGTIICLILGTEGIITSNKALLVADDENSWTFGQTLALLVLSIPTYCTIQYAYERLGTAAYAEALLEEEHEQHKVLEAPSIHERGIADHPGDSLEIPTLDELQSGSISSEQWLDGQNYP